MGQNGHHHARHAAASTTCCVLWTPAGTDPPAELLASLERRSLSWVGVQDGYSAMAEILMRRRSGESPKSAVLVLVHPTKLDLSGLVVDALGRFAGPVAVWRFDPDAQPVLAAAERHELATVFVRTQEGEPRRADQSQDRPPPSSPAASSDEGERRQVEPEDEEPTASSLLSDEELSMLLADRPGH
ncbi:MAG: hypothetical protein RIE77_02685 [Phycisphaerales bacterium]|jgi:hypothetical protein